MSYIDGTSELLVIRDLASHIQALYSTTHKIHAMTGSSTPIEAIAEPADELLGSRLTRSRERSKSPTIAQDVVANSTTTNNRSNDPNEGDDHTTTKIEIIATENEAREPETTQPVATPARKRAKANKSTLTCTMGTGAKICGKPMSADEIGKFARCPECRKKGRVASKKRNDKKRMRAAATVRALTHTNLADI